MRPHLGSGFPWHEPKRPHPELSKPDAWWQALGSVVARAVEAAGIDREIARDVGTRVRERYLNVSRFDIFPDVLPALRRLQDQGWKHVILSNHVPELPSIVEKLGLLSLFASVVSSANSGFEKPHPDAFTSALRAIGASKQVWMVGDDPDSDILGAEAIGIPAILVRGKDRRVARNAEDLYGAADLIANKVV